MKYLYMFFISTLLISCSQSSGIMEYGPDIYSVAVDVDSEFYGAGSAQKKAFEEAKAFCESNGKAISVQSVNNTANAGGYTSSSLLFRCIELHR